MRAAPAFLPAFLKAAEAVKTRSYQDSAGIWTIGVGHIGSDVHAHMLATMAQVDAWLDRDIAVAIRKLYAVLKPEAIDRLTEHQWGALISFAFNLGARASWTIWKRINDGKLAAVPAQIMRFDQARDPNTGKLTVLPGLEARRLAEKTLWLTADDAVAKAVLTASAEPLPPSSETRVGDTPPQPAHASLVKPLIMGAGAAATTAAPVINTMREAVAPLADQSEHVRQLLGLLAMIGAGLAIVTVAFLAWQSRQARL